MMNGFQPKLFPLKTLHQSTLVDFQMCERYGVHRHLHNIRIKGASRPALDIGTLCHAYLEEAATGVGRAKKKYQEMQALILKEVAYDKQRFELADLEDNKNLARVMAQLFTKRYPLTRLLEGKTTTDSEMLFAEKTIKVRIKGIPIPIEGTLDGGYDLGNDGCWIDDYKTASESPKERATTASFEFQMVVYPFLFAQWLLENERSWGRVRGFIHSIIQKPSIIFCGKDRNFRVNKKVLKSGPSKGEEREEKEFYGEPIWENYVARCNDWYEGTGEYKGDADLLKLEPRMDRSWTRLPDDFIQRDNASGKWIMQPGERFETLKRYAMRIRQVNKAGSINLDEWMRVTGNCRKWKTPCTYLNRCRGAGNLWTASDFAPAGSYTTEVLPR